jgi:hypothetical protein
LKVHCQADEAGILILLPDWGLNTLADLLDLLFTGRSAAAPLARATCLQQLLSALNIRLEELELLPVGRQGDDELARDDGPEEFMEDEHLHDLRSEPYTGDIIF